MRRKTGWLATLEKFVKVKHEVPMFSIGNVFSNAGTFGRGEKK